MYIKKVKMSENVPPVYIPSKKDVIIMKIKQIRRNKKIISEILNSKKNKMALNNKINNDELELGKSKVRSIMKLRSKGFNHSTTNTPKPNKPKPNNIINGGGGGRGGIPSKHLDDMHDHLHKCDIFPTIRGDPPYIKAQIAPFGKNIEAEAETKDDNFELKTRPIRPRIVLMNFDDDTMRPIIELDYKQMKILEHWYEICSVPVEFEMTDLIIPSGVPHGKLENILYNDLTYSMKNEFINSYLPLVFEQIISSDKIKKYEEMFSINNKKSYDTDIDLKDFKMSYNSISSNGIDDEEDDGLEEKFGGTLFYSSSAIPPTKTKDPLKKVEPKDFLLLKPEPMPEISNSILKKNKSSKYNSLYGIIIPKNLISRNSSENSNMMRSSIPIRYPSSIPNRDEMNDNNLEIVKYIFETQETILDNIEITPYNCDYNVLNPSFGSNAFQFSDDSSYELIELSCVFNHTSRLKQTDRKDVHTYSIMYNLKYNKSFVLKNPTEEEFALIKNIENYGFVNLANMQTNNDEISELINTNFGLCDFNSISELNLKLNAFSENVEYISKHVNVANNHANEETKVKTFILNNFTINNNIENRMKSSVLYDKIIYSKIVNKQDIASFKIRLAKYLQDMGLEKKRYSDGIYYYGIKSKF